MMGYWNQGILQGAGGPLRGAIGAARAPAAAGRGNRALPEVQPLGENGVLLDAADAVEEDGPLPAFHCGEKGPGQRGRGRNRARESEGDSPMKTDSRTP